jgi:hypothetical protein
MTVDDAMQFLVRYLRDRRAARDRERFGGGNYDVRLDLVARDYLAQSGTPEYLLNDAINRPDLHMEVFFAAAWELSRRGVLRPGVNSFGPHTTAPWAGGTGYSITPYGERWIREADEVDLVPMQPGRFAEILARGGERFGSGFVERAEEAVGSYNGHAFLACCAMCGAAAESILLALAIAKKGDDAYVLNLYAGRSGRSQVEKYLLSQQPAHVREEFDRYMGLLKHWRDDSAHGRAVKITEAEAYSSLALLLRFSIFAQNRWEDLTGRAK